MDIGAVGAAFAVTQKMLEERRISAGHDISDGGLAVALLEMAFAGNVGITADVSEAADSGGPLAALFAEELGLLLEVGATPSRLLMLHKKPKLTISRAHAGPDRRESRQNACSTAGRHILEYQTTLSQLLLDGCLRLHSQICFHRPCRWIQLMSRLSSTRTAPPVYLWRRLGPWQTTATSAFQLAQQCRSQVPTVCHVCQPKRM